MSVSQFLTRAKSASTVILKRNIGLAAPALQKATDPIQQLFADKIKEYRQKSSGGKLVEATPEIEKEWKRELDRLSKIYGGQGGEDMTKFPAFKFTDPQLDPINMTTE